MSNFWTCSHDKDEDNCGEEMEKFSKTHGDRYIFLTEKIVGHQNIQCKPFLASKVQKLKVDGKSKIYLFHQDCVSNKTTNISCNTQNSKATNKEFNIILASTISSVLLVCILVIVIVCLVKKDIICSKKQKSVDENTIVHQNDLYGNISNQDYFDERYDTNVVDKNENYEQYGEYFG